MCYANKKQTTPRSRPGGEFNSKATATVLQRLDLQMAPRIDFDFAQFFQSYLHALLLFPLFVTFSRFSHIQIKLIKMPTPTQLPFHIFHHGADLSDSISCFSVAFFEGGVQAFLRGVGQRGYFCRISAIHGYSKVLSRRAFMLFPPHSQPVGSPHFVLLVTNLYF